MYYKIDNDQVKKVDITYRDTEKQVVDRKTYLFKDGTEIQEAYIKGRLWMESFFNKKGQRHDQVITYETTSQQRGLVVSYKVGYINGDMVSKSYYKKGILIQEVPYVTDKIDGIKKEYFKTGEPQSETPYVKGKVHGKQISWFKNGAVRSVRLYQKGVLVMPKKVTAKAKVKAKDKVKVQAKAKVKPKDKDKVKAKVVFAEEKQPAINSHELTDLNVIYKDEEREIVDTKTYIFIGGKKIVKTYVDNRLNEIASYNKSGKLDGTQYKYRSLKDTNQLVVLTLSVYAEGVQAWHSIYEKGILLWEAFYDNNGHFHGAVTDYYKDGTVRQVTYYDHNKVKANEKA